MKTKLDERATAQTFEDCEPAIRQTVERFHRRYCRGADHELDLDELMGVAYAAFMHVYRNWTGVPEEKYTWCVARVINLRLHDLRRKRARRHRVAAKEPLAWEPELRMDAADGVESTDGLITLSVAMDMAKQTGPEDETLQARADRVREAVYRRLRGFGWAVARIAESFREIREVL